ncbi:MAG: hypothetical protein ACOY90_20300 [Candidatus Zhuqueibacterota bacterium]
MRNLFKFLTIVLIAGSANSLVAQEMFTRIRNQEVVGARPMALGGAFVALADDINAIYWNPAGLPAVNQLGLNFMYANLYGTGIGNNYFSLCIPGPPGLSFGLDWMSIGFMDEELEFEKNKFNFSAGYQVYDWLAIGLNARYLRMNASAYQLSQGSFHGWGFDWGFMARLNKNLKLGLVIHDLTDTKLNGLAAPVYRRSVRFGAAYKLLDNLAFLSDLDDRFHLGTEWWPISELLALRAGVEQDLYTNETATMSFGVGLELPIWGQSLRLDYAYMNSPTLMSTHRTSVSFLIDLFPQLVKIEKVEIEPIYASLYKHHAHNPVGTAYVRYKGKKDLKCKINFSGNRYMKEHTKNIILHPKPGSENVQEISLYTVFEDSVLYETDSIPLNADVKISYVNRYRPCKDSLSQEFKLYKRNLVNWELGVDQAAAFVTHEDPVIEQFALAALSDGAVSKQPFIINEQTTKALFLFNAVSGHGIQYDEDAQPVEGNARLGLDDICYPVQTLKDRRGDCDDLSVLLASLFENRNIPVAFVDFGEHISVIFSTGEHQGLASNLPYPDDLFFQYQNELWIPLEVTWIDSTFFRAWQKGAAEITKIFGEEQYRVIEIRKAWNEYQPVNYVSRFFRPMPLAQSHYIALKQDEPIQLKTNHLFNLEQKITLHPDSLELRNQLAIKYAFDNQRDKARTHFQHILARDSNNFSAINNLGNLFILEGRIDSAETFYLKAQQYAQNSDQVDGVKLNLGLVYLAIGQDSLAIDAFSEVMEHEENLQRIADLLKINFNQEDYSKGDDAKPKKPVSKNSVKQISAKAKTELNDKSSKPKEQTKQTRRQAVRKGSYLAPEKIDNVFYWAE